MSGGKSKIVAGVGVSILAAVAVLGFLAWNSGVWREPQVQSVAGTSQQQPQPALPPAQRAPAPSAQPTWLVRCTSRQDGLDCRAVQSIVVDRRRRTVLSVAVRVAADTKKPVLLLQVPLGVFLPAGVSIQVGNDAAKSVPFQSCGRAGCVARYPITEAELAAMLNGVDLRISAQNRNQQRAFTVRMPGAGFAAAYAKIK